MSLSKYQGIKARLAQVKNEIEAIYGALDPLDERFWRKVEPGGPDDCWLFRGYDRRGYPLFRYKPSRNEARVASGARRYAIISHFGEIPEGIQIVQGKSCPSICVHPLHVRPRRGAWQAGQQKNVSSASLGELFTPEQLAVGAARIAANQDRQLKLLKLTRRLGQLRQALRQAHPRRRTRQKLKSV